MSNAGHLILPVQGEDHREEGVKLGALHDLSDSEDGFGELLFVCGDGEINPHLEGGDVTGDERVLRLDGRDVVELCGDLIEIDVEAADDVEEGIHVDGLFRDVAQGGVLEFGGGEVVFDDVEDAVSDDAFGGGEVAHAHFNDPSFFGAEGAGVPLECVFRHVDDVGFPVICLHLFVDAVGFVVLEGKHVEFCGTVSVDDAFAGDPFAGFGFVEAERFVPELVDDDVTVLFGRDFSVGAGEVERIEDGGFGGVWGFEQGGRHTG